MFLSLQIWRCRSLEDEGVLCVAVFSITVKQDCARLHLLGSSQSSHLQQHRFGHDTKNSKRKVVCAGEKDLDDQEHQMRRSSMFV